MYGIYADQLTPQTTPTDRHIIYSIHGASGDENLTAWRGCRGGFFGRVYRVYRSEGSWPDPLEGVLFRLAWWPRRSKGFQLGMSFLLSVHSLELTWKWRMAPWKTMFHYRQVVFHFHVSSRESKLLGCVSRAHLLHDESSNGSRNTFDICRT